MYQLFIYTDLADSAKRKAYDLKQKNALYLFRSGQGSGLSLWKTYLVYNLVFYISISVVFVLGYWISTV